MPDDQFQFLLDSYTAQIRGGSPDTAERVLDGLAGGDKETCQAVLEAYREKCRVFVDYTDPRVMRDDPNIESWYPGPDWKSAVHWPAFKKLLPAKGLDQHDIDKLNESSSRIMAHLPHPQTTPIDTRGLVIGYVQSGKTSNYSALITKAADVGYRFFIVLAGMTSSLRQQTQKRLSREVCSGDPEAWLTLTHVESDFRSAGLNPSGVFGLADSKKRVIAVVKKNTHVLERLIRFMKRAKPQILGGTPALIIDDEADQASVNTQKRAEARTAINQKVIRILDTLPNAAYIAYTATPFANIFIDPAPPEDLYPRHFIFSLPRPQKYFGAERVFGRNLVDGEDEDQSFDGLDVARKVKPAEERQLKPASRDTRFEFQPQVTDSLRRAVLYFYLATACRYARKQEEHSSMLVHTTYFTDTHEKLQAVIGKQVDEIGQQIDAGGGDLWEEMKSLWAEEADRVDTSDMDPQPEPVSFDTLAEVLPQVQKRMAVQIDNGELGSGLEYPDLDGEEEPRVYIAVGGNTLSRGLTLEGLVVSYFVRHASAYDTLLQMGRWFGFRPGYEDLPRVWMPEQLQLEFMHLATVEEEIRNDIARYEKSKVTPIEFAVRVRSHPHLLPTSKMKMQNCHVTSASFSSSREQTTRFRHDDANWLEENINAARELIGAGGKAEQTRGGPWLIRNVDVEHILAFLNRYQIVPEHEELKRDLLTKYIGIENNHGALTKWNVAVMGLSNPRRVLPRGSKPKGEKVKMGTLELGLPEKVNCINRSRFTEVEPAYLKAIASPKDSIVDLELDRDPGSEDARKAARQEQLPNHGLLLLYPISKHSTPGQLLKNEKRHPLNAADHIVGLSLVFPESVTDQSEYVANDLGEVLKGAVEDPAAQDLEEDDELLARAATGGEEELDPKELEG